MNKLKKKIRHILDVQLRIDRDIWNQPFIARKSEAVDLILKLLEKKIEKIQQDEWEADSEAHNVRKARTKYVGL